MSQFFNKINAFFKADWWSGASWLILLCMLETLIGGVYLFSHRQVHGYEYLQLEPAETKTLNDLLALYPDTESPTSIMLENLKNDSSNHRTKRVCDSICNLRQQRTNMIGQFLRTAYREDMRGDYATEIDSAVKKMETTLNELNTRDVATYISSKKFKVPSYFWLSGPNLYWEAALWSLIGVITSLIYYVSLANQQQLKAKADEDIGAFDSSEIASQVGKMFYAPVITLVLVLGYTYISGASKSSVDLTVNHGLILFSFVAGFYSGRLMKLLDGLKKVLLPISSDGTTVGTNTTTPAATADISVQVELDPSLEPDPDAPGITEAGFNSATVWLEAADNPALKIPLDKPADDQSGGFGGKGVKYGKYSLKATYDYNTHPAYIQLSGQQDIEISAGSTDFTLLLKK